jgi:hypothetical protein
MGSSVDCVCVFGVLFVCDHRCVYVSCLCVCSVMLVVVVFVCMCCVISLCVCVSTGPASGWLQRFPDFGRSMFSARRAARLEHLSIQFIHLLLWSSTVSSV